MWALMMPTVIWLAAALTTALAGPWSQLNLPEEHIPYFFNNNPALKQQCGQDDKCPYKDLNDAKDCWGYEKNCPEKLRMYSPKCTGQASAWVRGGGIKDQVDNFWKASDFGYIKERRTELETLCTPKGEDDSSLSCASHTKYCRAKHLFIDFKNLKSKDSRQRFQENVFKSGEIGGHCKMNRQKLKALGDHKSPLQSWYAELEEYSGLDFKPSDSKNCDIVLDKPTIFMKLDAGVNMYHHYCDYINLYASQHINNSFTTDVNIVMWDTSSMGYGDFFSDTWKAFTDHRITHLKEFDGKKVCVKDAMFPLLPRMRYGMYYNMPLIPGCYNSSLYRAFSQHLIHRLGITQQGPLEKKIRVTLLERNTKYRKILNQYEVVYELKKNPNYEVKVVDFNHKVPFLEQLQVTHNSDILMGMHGAGLTHMLFLPDWANIFEIYNCDDEHCYKDLARLRGVNYFTWENEDLLQQEDEGHHPTLGAHKKFTNYAFDVDEFARLVARAADRVRGSDWYQRAWQAKWGNRVGSQAEGARNGGKTEL